MLILSENPQVFWVIVLYTPAFGEIFLLSINMSEPKLLCMNALMHVQISVSIFHRNSLQKSFLLDAKVQPRELSTSSSKCCNLSVKWQGGNYKDQVKYLSQSLQAIRLEMFALGIVAQVWVMVNQSGKNLGSLAPSPPVICRR